MKLKYKDEKKKILKIETRDSFSKLLVLNFLT